MRSTQGAGYHIYQSLIAVGTGGLTGRGYMEGMQKLFYLPEASTDFIFANIAEELGFIGAIFIVLLFVVFGVRGLRAAFRSQDPFARLVAFGITTTILLQAFFNISVVLSLVPTKGIPLPLISSGGTSLFFTLASIGVLLNITEEGWTELADLRVLIAGGGTGGHIIPALAVAHELVERHAAEVLFVGTSRGMEIRLVPEAGFNLRLIDVGPLKNVSLMTRLRTLLSLPRSISGCIRLIREFKPSVVFGVGGYASGPAMAAALRLKVPTMAFEPNAMPGLANRLVGKTGAGRGGQLSLGGQVVQQLRGHGYSGAPGVLQADGADRRRAAFAGLRRLAGSAHLQYPSAPDHCGAARCGSRPDGPAPERGSPRRFDAGGLCCKRSRSAAVGGAAVFRRYAGAICRARTW